MKDLICLKCPESRFLDPSTEICWKTGGLWCGRLKRIVGKFDPCHIPSGGGARGAGGGRAGGGGTKARKGRGGRGR
ncbi:MAG: hypothetical protein ACE5EI_03825 [Thermodesulfobacteriota bacterium]